MSDLNHLLEDLRENVMGEGRKLAKITLRDAAKRAGVSWQAFRWTRQQGDKLANWLSDNVTAAGLRKLRAGVLKDRDDLARWAEENQYADPDPIKIRQAKELRQWDSVLFGAMENQRQGL